MPTRSSLSRSERGIRVRSSVSVMEVWRRAAARSAGGAESCGLEACHRMAQGAFGVAHLLDDVAAADMSGTGK